MKVLHLTLKKKWFDLIRDGEKLEEYREQNPFWYARLVDRYETNRLRGNDRNYVFENFDVVQFYNGWACSTKYPNFQIQCNGIEIREGNPEWGAEPGKKYFVIKLGEKLKG